MTLFETFERAYDYARVAEGILDRTGLPAMSNRDWSDAEYANQCRYLLELASRGDESAWQQLMYVAASAELARQVREVGRVDVGETA